MKPKSIIIFNRFKYFGGTIVLSCLCKTLREMGYDARLFMCIDIPFNSTEEAAFTRNNIKKLTKHFLSEYTTKVKKWFCKKSNSPFPSDITSIDMDGLAFHKFPLIDKENSIVIYPEVTYGNPLHAKHVIRWLMYHYPYSLKSKAYSPNDVFVAYRKVFNSPELNPENVIISQSYFNKELYRQYNEGERKGNCYILRKGRNRADLPKEFDGPVFDDNMSQKELVRMFNTYKYCYSYDTQTFYTKIASICGCIPIVIMEPGKNASDYLSPDEYHYGVAYGNTPEQIDYAIRTRDLCLKSVDYSESNKENAQLLVELLVKRFGPIKRIQ